MPLFRKLALIAMLGCVPGWAQSGSSSAAPDSSTAQQDQPAPNPGAVPGRIHAEPGAMQGLLQHKVAPAYPPLARQARIQGTVILQALIDKEGAISDLKLISGHPMLAPAAMEAVRQWRYKPYLLEGAAVNVETEVQVIFKLQEDPPSQVAPNSDKKAPADQAPPPSPGDSTKLEPIKTEKADYPWQARENQLQGQVWVKILVSDTGDVENAAVLSGDPILAAAAVQAVKKWKFKPFVRNGKPVAVSTKVPFDFAFSGNVHEEKVPPAEGEAPERVRVGQGVSTGLLVYKVQPVYPERARRDNIQGTVVLQAVISKEGRIIDLKLISGPKELAPAAIGAVQQWRYRPYMLKGEPVEVETVITVNFQLTRR